MGSIKRLVLENKKGERIRSFRTEGDGIYQLISRLDTGRLELHSDLEELKNNKIEYIALETIDLTDLSNGSIQVRDIGRISLDQNKHLQNKSYSLTSENDEENLKSILKKTGLSHLIMVMFLIVFSLLLNAIKKEQTIEPQLVTIVIPQPEIKSIDPVLPLQSKINPRILPPVRITNRNIQTKNTKRQIVRKLVQPHRRPEIAPIVSKNPERTMDRVGALAALGGLKNGARNSQGLDINSIRNIRAAGIGTGGGGIGQTGPGGVSGMMNGRGLIAGSSGQGGKAQSAGGYGTKGIGGGKAGYGKIAIVGGMASLGLPSDEAEVQGGLAMEQIAAVVRKNEGQIRYCYEQGLQAQPDLRGRVAMKFVIGGTGRITTLKVAQSSLGSRAVEACIAQKMKTWQFPQPVGSVNVDVLYPFDLSRVSAN